MSASLILVVGPSGAGKDTLIAGARAQLAGDPTIVFPAREITRPVEAGGEEHVPVDTAAFEARRAAGAYALAWCAHGQFYGIPKSIDAHLAAGQSVIVNVSRTVIDDARARYRNVKVISIVVDEKVLRKRLQARGREAAEDIEQRLARASAYRVSGPDVSEFCNEGDVETGVARFVDLVRSLVGVGV